MWRFQVDGKISSVIVRDVDEDLHMFQVVDLIFLTLTSLRCYGDNHFFTTTEVPIQNKENCTMWSKQSLARLLETFQFHDRQYILLVNSHELWWYGSMAISWIDLVVSVIDDACVHLKFLEHGD